MKLRIVRSALSKKFKNLEEVDGTYDYLGQMLVQMKHPTMMYGKPVKLPSELKRPIFPFTQSVRGTILDSCVTLQVLQLSPGKDGEERLIKIMSSVGFEIIVED